MRALALAVIALLLVGCKHMYGAGDAGRFTSAPLGSR